MRDLPGLRLPPDVRSAAMARRHVREAVGGSALEQVLDDALLVVTELVTNAVLHAGTEVELRLRDEQEALWLEVADRLPGVLPLLRAPDDERESGRGVLLLDALATEWGTAHRSHGKAVWCRFSPAGATPEPSQPAPAPAVGAPAVEDLDLAWVVDLPADLEQRLPLEVVVRELLDRLCDALHVDHAAVLAVLGPDSEAEQVAVRGEGLREEDVTAVPAGPRGPQRVLDLGELLVLPLVGGLGQIGAVVLRPGRVLSPQARALARVVADRLTLLIVDHLREQQRQRDRGALALLAEASELFAESLDVRLAASLTTQLLVPRFGSGAAVVTLPESAPRVEAVTCRDEERSTRLRELLESREGHALVVDLAARGRAGRAVQLPQAGVLAEFGPHVVAVPLVARRRSLGVLVVVGERTLPTSDVPLLLDLARRAAQTLDNARLYEESSAVARTLQESLLPSSLPQAVGLSFGARYAAAGTSQVGGDFYDVFPLPGGGYGLTVGDVCGKGPEAAAITGLARQVLRGSMQDGFSLPACFQRLNDVLLEMGDRGRFLTAAAGVVEVDGDVVRVRLCNAGHPLPALLGEQGAALVGQAGDLVGVMPAVAVSESHLALQRGESLVFYTDGVTERRDGGTQFGEGSLLDLLRGRADLSAQALARHVEEEVREFSTSAPRDDLAVLVVRADGPARAVEPARAAPAERVG
ncbi:serine phosphatase RsbU (regulator of sigma subunit) [Kineococcus xinjiangensis]|uniref:Serine phosphatase RsbU (Regulator of sigma subunit) n=1 Tax=Kineococcus xinjiangensis TaxID=512762 RepID=A0A2S6IV65_9ACTN|nr:SpoIIE family protein phosphatase [Kineococcus xinjiangensis]PPK98043.1 serine phosphatase RsbU (regulator of sigma subunit) [Kineococcus xinjiangensis]